MPSRNEKIKEMAVLIVLNVALPTVDVYTDVALFVKFYSVGSRHNPWCDEEAIRTGEWGITGIYYRRRFDCYYDDSVDTSRLTYTQHYDWGTMMLVPFLLNYLICWYVWATTDKRKAFTWVHSSAKKLFSP